MGDVAVGVAWMQGNLVVGQLRERRVWVRRQPKARRGVFSIESASLYRIQMFRLLCLLPGTVIVVVVVVL